MDFTAEPATKTRKVVSKPKAPRASRSKSRTGDAAAPAIKKKPTKKAKAKAEAPTPAPTPVDNDVVMEEAMPPAAFSQKRYIATGFLKGGQRLERDVVVATHAADLAGARDQIAQFARENAYDEDGHSMAFIAPIYGATAIAGNGKTLKVAKTAEERAEEPWDEQRVFYSVGHDVGNRFLREHGSAHRIVAMSKSKEGASKYIKRFVKTKLGGDPNVEFGLYRLDPKENHTCTLVSGSEGQ